LKDLKVKKIPYFQGGNKMIKRTLNEVQSMAKGHGLKSNSKDIVINGVSTDTRTIKEGELYVPIIGEVFNGHEFIQSAVENGAIAALWCENEKVPNVDIPLILVDDTLKAIQRLSKEYRNELSIKVVGITGSNGKTSTKDILGSILSTKYKTFKTKGNLNNYLGVPLTLLSLDESIEVAVIEMGMSSLGEIEVLTNIATPDAAIITNVGDAHLEELKTRENVRTAKLEIVNGLKSDGLFVYNGDDDALRNRVSKLGLNQKTETFGENSSNDYCVKAISIDKDGINFEIKNKDSGKLFLPMLGAHQIHNATAAIAVARHFGLSFDLIKKGLSEVSLTKMRSQLIHGNGFDILNDSYNANPASTKAALKTIYSLKGYSQKIVVFGDMLELGENEVDMHREIGSEIDFNEIDYLFTIGKLAKYAGEEGKKVVGDKVKTFLDKEELVNNIKEVLREGCIILLKGSRGLKLETIGEALLGDEN